MYDARTALTGLKLDAQAAAKLMNLIARQQCALSAAFDRYLDG
jgi:hypothetical protein